MNKILISIALMACLAGCGTTRPTTEKIESSSIAWLQDNKDLVRRALVLAGFEVMNRATNPEERKEIANQMWTVSTAFYSLATGNVVTKEQLDATIASFTKGNKAPGFTKFIAQASVLWASIFPKLKLTNEVQLGLDYLNIFASAAQEVAATYKDINA